MATAPSILVIDDEQGILETLRILLKNEGFDITTAQGGKAGLEQLKGSAPDIVLTDLKMPGVTGIEILSAVRGQDPERDRKSTRLNSSHGYISYAVFCLKKKKKNKE